jgi:hypothetical protein
MIDITKLKAGDIIKHIESGDSYTVRVISSPADGCVQAIREMKVCNPQEWEETGLTEKPSRNKWWRNWL